MQIELYRYTIKTIEVMPDGLSETITETQWTTNAKPTLQANQTIVGTAYQAFDLDDDILETLAAL